MEGAARAAKRRFDMAIVTAWHTAVFALNGYGGKLKGLSEYIATEKGQRSDAADALAFFHSMKSRGLPVTIERVVH